MGFRMWMCRACETETLVRQEEPAVCGQCESTDMYMPLGFCRGKRTTKTYNTKGWPEMEQIMDDAKSGHK